MADPEEAKNSKKTKPKPKGSLGKLLVPLAIGLALGGGGLLGWNWMQPIPEQKQAPVNGIPYRTGTLPIPKKVLTIQSMLRGGYDPMPATERVRGVTHQLLKRSSIARHPLHKLAILSLELPELQRVLGPHLSERQSLVLKYANRIASRWVSHLSLDPKQFIVELRQELRVIERYNDDLANHGKDPIPKDFVTALAVVRNLNQEENPGLAPLKHALRTLRDLEREFEARAPELPPTDSLNPSGAVVALLNLVRELLTQVQVEWYYRPDPLDPLPERNHHDIIGRTASRLLIRSDPVAPPPPIPADSFAMAWEAACDQYDEDQRMLDPTYRAAHKARRQRIRSQKARKTAEDLRRIRSWAEKE